MLPQDDWDLKRFLRISEMAELDDAIARKKRARLQQQQRLRQHTEDGDEGMDGE